MNALNSAGKGPGDIAIVGMAVNLPGAPDLGAFWRNLRDGVESISRLDPTALRAAGERPEVMRREAYVPAAGLLDGYDLFDAAFFGFSPREAAILDPQHRKFLETAWEAFENAGHAPESFAGRIGVFAGCGAGSYLYHNLLANPDLVDELGPFQLRNTGNDKDFLATRVAHVLDLKGPALTIQTACSTALVGLHQAAKALADGECDMALAGGVSVEMPHGRGYLYRENDILSPDGHCRAFDHRAGGTVMGSGAGAVLLRRLDEALADGDHIWAIVKGTAVNNDGADKAGFFAPSEAGQADVVGRALDAAGVAPETIGYVECHGTGTLLGDPFEVAGLTQAWRARGAEGVQTTGIGSVQTNVGNLDTAAAVTGLVKTALALHHGEIPPSLNYEAPNPMIDFAASPFFVADEPLAWPEGRRRAAVNTLGVGGTNAHAVLEPAPAAAPHDPGLFPFQPIVLSGPSPAALEAMAARLAGHLRAHPDLPLADVAYTLIAGRKRFDHSLVLVARDTAEAAAMLEAGEGAAVFTQTRRGPEPELAFLYPHSGAIAGAVDLYETEPVFRDMLDRGFAAFAERTGDDLFAVVLAGAGDAGGAGAKAAAHVLTMAALGELALSWGVVPAALHGAGLGTLAAAVTARVIGVEDAVGLAWLTGRIAETDSAARTAARRALRSFAAEVAFSEPVLPLHSARTGGAMTDAQATNRETWATLTDEARFGEIAPDHLRLALAPVPGALTAAPTRGAETGTNTAGDVHFIATLARLWAMGAAVDWAQFWAGARRQRLPLPGVAFQRERYLIAPARAGAGHQGPALLRKDDMEAWGWRPVWHKAYAPCEIEVETDLAAAPRQTWLVFEDNDGIAEAAFARLEEVGHRVVRVTPGDSFAETGPGRYTLLTEQGREGYAALLADLAGKDLLPNRIAHFWGVFGAEMHRLGSDPFHDHLEFGFYSLTWLAQALGGIDLPEPVHITAVTRDAASVNGGPVACPEKATITGPAGVIARELPGLSCTTIDLAPAEAPSRKGLLARRAPKRDAEALVPRLLEDLLAAPGSETIAYRGARRYRLGYAKAPLTEAETPAFRDGGTYLITGGLGEIGLDLAASLVAQHQARVILTGRRALPPRDAWDEVARLRAPTDPVVQAITGIRRLEALGGDVEIARADVTNLEAMRAVVASVTERHGRIDGVLHAAGLIDDGPLLGRDAQAIEHVFAPKIDGLRVLDELFPDGSTDLMVLFSSTATAIRGAGEADFAAANAYFDAYAQSRQGSATRVVALNWGVWSEIGMVARAVEGADPTALAPTPVAAPLITAAGFDPDGTRALTTQWQRGRAWLFDQHAIDAPDAPGVMPAAALIELAIEAHLAEGGSLPLALSDLRFDAPFFANAPTPQSVVRLAPAEGGRRVELQSGAGDRATARETLATLHVAALAEPAAPAPVDLGAVALRCRDGALNAAGAEGHLPRPQAARVAHGPAWQALRETALGDREGLARLDLPAGVLQDPGLILHPALLDIALNLGVALAAPRDDTVWRTEAVTAVTVYRPLPAEVACWVRRAEAAVETDDTLFDVTLCGLDGSVHAEFTGVKLAPRDIDEAFKPEPIVSAPLEPAAAAPKRSPAEDRLARMVAEGIRPGGEGFAALDRALGLGLPQVAVSTLDLAELIAAAEATAPAPYTAGQSFARPALVTAYAAPETETEAALADEWSKLLGIAEPGIDDDFFDLGGHSLIAVRLCANVNAAYGTDFGLAVLAEAPTIRDWAARIDAATAPTGEGEPGAQPPRQSFTHIVPLNRTSQPQAVPVFLVSGMFGNVLNLRHVAQILAEDRPVYGLQAKGLLGDDTPFETFEAAARSKIAEIRQIQPKGPYVVGGFSGGGITALEIARALEAEGEEVALVVLLDTYKVHDPVLSRADKALIKLAEFRQKGPGYLGEWLRNRLAWEVNKRRQGETAPEGGFHNHRIEMAFRASMAAYAPPTYDMNVVLMRPALERFYKVSRGQWVTSEKRYVSHDNDWGPHIPKLEVVEVPGDHGSMVLVPNVGVLGTYLRTRIDAALAHPGLSVPFNAREAAE